MFSESRLIGYIKATDKTRYSTRVADANAQLQAQAHQQALAENQAAGTIQTRNAATVRDQQLQGPLTTDAGINNDPTAAGILSQAVGAGQTINYNGATGAITTPSTVAPMSSDMSPRTGLRSTNIGIPSGASLEDPNVRAGVEGARAAIEQQNTQKMQQNQQKQQQKDQARQQGGTVGVPSATDSMMENLKLMASSNPDLAAFLPQIEALAGQQNSQTAGAQNMYNDAMGDFASDDLNGDGVTDGVASSVSESKQILKGEKDQQDAINLENRDIATESAELAKDMAQLEKDKFELNQLRNENLVREQNIEAELKNRRVANKLGINADTNGLKWMATEIRKGNEHLSYLEQSGDIQSAQFALQIGREYNLNIKSALNNYNAQQAQIDSVFRKELENLDSVVSMDAKERQKEKKEWNKWLFEQKAEIDKETSRTIREINKDMLQADNAFRDDRRAQETLGWDVLNKAIDNYGSMVPQSIIERVQKMLPEGTDIYDIINTPTITERNSKRISGSGGTGSAGGGSYVPTGSEATAASLFSNVTPQQLRESVNRIFAPANYGGTAGEREDRKQDYLNRIASGENPASIMTSLQNDYWASQKGAPRTAHDGRIDAQSSADALLSYVDFYSITGEDDGPLGRLDSKVQWVKSWFGQSSEEYNNLATNVGNIRARIIKENYGAAVTPQELTIAQSYIPDLNDKGDQFVTKIHNLKAYNAYLDAKQFAANAGLPLPTPPAPVSLTGIGMSGPAKYSSSDIASALLE